MDLAQDSGMQMDYGLVQASDGGAWNAAGNIAFGSLGLIGGVRAGKLLSAAGRLDPADKSGQLSLVGRALHKHGSREGSLFFRVMGSPSEINA